jgi:hypothetical protein
MTSVSSLILSFLSLYTSSFSFLLNRLFPCRCQPAETPSLPAAGTKRARVDEEDGGGDDYAGGDGDGDGEMGHEDGGGGNGFVVGGGGAGRPAKKRKRGDYERKNW